MDTKYVPDMGPTDAREIQEGTSSDPVAPNTGGEICALHSAEAESSRRLSERKGHCLAEQKPVVKLHTESGFLMNMTDMCKKGTFYIWNNLEWVFLISVGLVCSFAIPFLRNKKFWKLMLWEWEILALVLTLMVGWIIRIIVFFIKWKFPLRKRVLDIINKICKALQNCLWFGFFLVACVMDKKVHREPTIETLVHVINKILVCLAVLKMLWLLKTAVVDVLAFCFDVNAYFDRIGKSLFDQYVIEKLSGPSLSEKNENQKEEERIVNLVEAFSIESFLKLDSQDVTAEIINEVKNFILGGQITYSNHDESATKIEKEDDAEVAAMKIFQNIVAQGSLSFNQKDVMRFMPETEALKIMSFFEKLSGNKEISQKCFKIWVVNAFRERKALASALSNTANLVDRLHRMVMIIVVIVTLIVCFLILGIATGRSLFLVFLTAGLLTAIICKLLCDAIIFLFVMHPFDKGDWCAIEEQLMRVEQINTLTTVFQTEKTQSFKTMNNSFLATMAIENYSRSPHMVDEVEYFIPVAAPEDKIKIIKQSITSYIEKNEEHWYPLTDKIIYKKMKDVNKVLIAIRLTHKMKHPDMNERLSRRGLFIEEMTKVFKELDIH